MPLSFERLFCLIVALAVCIIPFGLDGQVTAYQKVIDDFVKSDAFNGASIGISIIDVSNKNVLATHDSNRKLIPASTLKLLTTAAAFEQFGADYRFETKVHRSGTIEDGVLKGDLIIEGNGDPSLASEYFSPYNIYTVFEEVITALNALGIKEIDGDIFAVTQELDGVNQAGQWQWQDIGNYYGANAWQLNIADNKFAITFKQQNQIGSIPPIVKIEPQIPQLELTNYVTTASARSGDNAYVYGVPYQNQRFISGTIPAGKGLFTIYASMPNPPLFTAQWLKSSLAKGGISVSGKGKVLLQKDWSRSFKESRVVHAYLSPSISELAGVTNKESHNVFAEALFNIINRDKSSPDGLSMWLRSIGVDESTFKIADGSGLSRKNVCSANVMTTVLDHIYEQPYFEDYIKSLAEPGREGTLKNTFTNMPAGTSIKAKSGSLSGVMAYVGYLRVNDNTLYSFAIIVNNHHGYSSTIRKKMERLIYDIASM